MAKNPQPGDLRARMTFAERQAVSDGYGNEVGAFVDQFTVWARIMPLRAGEDVMAGRLTGTQPVIITVRQTEATRRIAAEWRATDARTGLVYAITGPPTDPDNRRAWLDIVAATGRAA